MNQNKKIFASLLFIYALIVGMYYPVLGFGYVWDDTLLFVGKTGLLTEPLSWALITEPVLPGTTYFRPLVFLFWYAEFHIFGHNTVISHLVGLIVFALNSSLVFALAYMLADRLERMNPIKLATLAAIFYVLHPTLVESTVWVSGRFDQFATFFTLLACIVFVRSYTLNKNISLSTQVLISISFFAALLSKELGLILPLLLVCLYFLLAQQQSTATNLILFKQALKQYKYLIALLGIVLVGYFSLRINAMSHLYHAPMTINHVQESILNNWLPLQTLVFYIQHTFVPFSTLNILHPLDNWDFTSIVSRIKALLVLVLVMSLIYMAWAKRSAVAWLWLASIVSVLLVLNIIPLGIVGNIGHERFMTLGLAFVAIALVLIPYTQYFTYLKIKPVLQKGILYSIITLWLLLAVLTIKSVLPFWKNDYTLWTWTYKLHPETPIARFNYLYGAMERGLYQEVIKEAQKQIQRHGGLEVADQVMYASALVNVFDEDGMRYFEGAIYALPKFHESTDKNARQQADQFWLTAGQMGGAYTSYAMGKVVFENNPSVALQYLDIAEWYLLADEKETFNYYKVAVLFANQQYQEAMQLYKQQLVLSQKYNSKQPFITRNVLNLYCERYPQNTEVCRELLANTVFLTSTH